MFMRSSSLSSSGRIAVLATAAAIALTAFQPQAAFAGTAAPVQGASTAAVDGVTDFSAQRRRHVRRGGGGGAAAAAAFAGIIGTGIAIAASQNRRAYYHDGYYGDGYYGGGPVYYGGGPYESYGYYDAPTPYYGGYGYRHSGVPHFQGHPLAGW